MNVSYEWNPGKKLNADTVLELFEQAGIAKPNWTSARMTKSLSGCASIVCAWHKDELVGFASAVSDRAWIAYLSQLAVKPQFQRQGIGKTLVERISQDLGDEVTMVLHSAEGALEFYQSAGFRPYSNVLVKTRKR